jgi:hypothetical protein
VVLMMIHVHVCDCVGREYVVLGVLPVLIDRA